MKTFKQILAHICVILVVIDITLLIVNICNPHMGFLDNIFADCVTWALPITCLIFSVTVIATRETKEK